jgi:hypothetical protein
MWSGEAGTTAGLSRFSLSLSPQLSPGMPGASFCRQLVLPNVGTTAALKSRQLYPNSQRHLRAVDSLVEARRRGPMRAYVTAAGMALGLVGVWAALVPFVA